MISQQQKEKYFPEQYEFVKGRRQQLENTLNELLCDYKGGSFLEIGLGPKVRIERAKLMQDMSISYTGLDFDEICKNHASVLADQGITDLEFIGNRVGSYLYNLIRLRRKGRMFDVIYLDGHHTLYIDFAAAFACVPLLKPNGVIAFDDVRWSLGAKEKNLKDSEFYKDLYDFDLYEQDEKDECHIEVIIKEYLIPVFGLEICEKYSMPNWIALRSGHIG